MGLDDWMKRFFQTKDSTPHLVIFVCAGAFQNPDMSKLKKTIEDIKNGFNDDFKVINWKDEETPEREWKERGRAEKEIEYKEGTWNRWWRKYRQNKSQMWDWGKQEKIIKEIQ